MLSKHKPHLEIALRMCESVGSPYAKAALPSLLCGKFKLPSLDPDAYDDRWAFGKDYAIYAYLRKFSAGDTYDCASLDRRALLGFEETEARLQKINRFLMSPTSLREKGVAYCTEAVRRKMEEILGRFDPFEWLEGCEWGPGATSTLSAREATLDKKILESQISVTRQALPFYRWILENDPHMFHARAGTIPEGPYSVLKDNFAITDCSRLTTVDKSFDERRVIDIQPTANLFLQKGVGKMIRNRLKRYGIDLDDQSRNQWLASVAQRLQLCTLDLAKASDSISTSLVKCLLNAGTSRTLGDWYFVLNALRTESTSYKGRKYILHKFSAMGNGYTFELESLIFYAIILSVYEFMGLQSDVAGVYGDDLIVTRAACRNVVTLLEHFGFQVNNEKSFTRGRFYESCGKHYFDGKDVTPPYQKEEIRDIPSAIRGANRLFRFALRSGGGAYLDRTFYSAWQQALTIVNSFWDSAMERRSKRGLKRLKFPFIPFWLPDDFGLLYDSTFEIRNGMLRFSRLNVYSLKVPADHSALYSTALRRKCVVENPFLGLVTVRGVTKMAGVSVGRTTPTLARFPDWY